MLILVCRQSVYTHIKQQLAQPPLFQLRDTALNSIRDNLAGLVRACMHCCGLTTAYTFPNAGASPHTVTAPDLLDVYGGICHTAACRFH